MTIEDRIARKEQALYSARMYKGMLKDAGFIDMVEETKEDIRELKKSIEDDRKVQLAEAQTSGRKKWTEDIWKYILIILITSILSAFSTKLIFG